MPTPERMKLDLVLTIDPGKLSGLIDAIGKVSDAHGAMGSALEELGRCLTDLPLEVQNGVKGSSASLVHGRSEPASAGDRSTSAHLVGRDESLRPATPAGHD